MNRYDGRMQELRGEPAYASKGGQAITLSEDDLQQIERKIGHALPADYRDFLRSYGCYTLYAFFRAQQNFGGWGSIRQFYGLIPKNHATLRYSSMMDLVNVYQSLNPYKPIELLPIGDSPGGSKTCLSLAGEHSGAVYFWDRTEAWQTTDYTGIYFVANSFDEFMRLLKTQEEYENEVGPIVA